MIEVRQNGILQCEASVPAQGRQRAVSFGRHRKNQLSVEFGKVPETIPLFTFRDGSYFALLEPRIEGFVNNGAEFGTVAEFLTPIGSLSKLASVADPFALRLGDQARGVLRLGEFEILFKIGRPKSARYSSRTSASISRAPFAPPTADTALERHIIWAALAFALFIFVPGLIWLTMAPYKKITSLERLPDHFLIQFIHPEHFRFLPRIYAEEYRADHAVAQAMHWVSELQRRWDAEMVGAPAHSNIPLLNNYTRKISFEHIEEGWRSHQQKTYQELEKKRQSSASPRYYSFQSQYPVLALETAGGSNGSLYLRHLTRIRQLDTAYDSLRQMIEIEQEFVNRSIEEMGGQRKGIFSEPTPPRDQDYAVDPEFARESDRFRAAEGWSRRAAQSIYWSSHYRAAREQKAIEESLTKQGHVSRPAILWVKKESLLTPTFASPDAKRSSAAEQALLRNALYADGVIHIPPPPQPKPILDRKRVELVVIDRREEVRGCYESALRRNPKLEGLLRLSWEVNTKGQGQNVKIVSSSIASVDLVQCMKQLLLDWRYPKSKHGPVRVAFPFRFQVER